MKRSNVSIYFLSSIVRDVGACKPAAKMIMNFIWACTTAQLFVQGEQCDCTRELQTSIKPHLKMGQSTKPKCFKNKTQVPITSTYTCLLFRTSSTYQRQLDRMWPHTINNNWLQSLKDFLRQKCLQYQYCPSLACSAVVSYLASLCVRGFPATETVSRLGMGICPLGDVSLTVGTVRPV